LSNAFSKYVSTKQKIFYGLLAGNLFCIASANPAIAQQHNAEIKLQIQELPLPVANEHPEENGLLRLDSCGLKQSPNQQDILAYCYGHLAIQTETGTNSAWLQLLQTQDNKLSWLQKQPTRVAWSGETKLEGLDDHHRLVVSQPQGLSYLILDQAVLSRIFLTTFIRNPEQIWVIQEDLKTAGPYFDPEQIVVTTSKDLFVLALDSKITDYSMADQDFYNVSKFNKTNRLDWQFEFKRGINRAMIAQAEKKMRDLLSAPSPDEQVMLSYDTFISNAKWLSNSWLEKPNIFITPKGETFIYHIAAKFDPESAEKVTIENNFRIQLYCISADGKNTYKNSLPYSNYRHGVVYSPDDTVALITHFPTADNWITVFQAVWINEDCTIKTGYSLLAPLLYSGLSENGIFNGLQVDGHDTEFLQAKNTANGDILIVYTEGLPESYKGPLFPYQLNIALFSQEGDLKAIAPIITADQPSAWYLHELLANLNVDLVIGADNRSAFISIFNPKPLDDQNHFGYEDNIFDYTASFQGVEYKPQPKFFKITW